MRRSMSAQHRWPAGIAAATLLLCFVATRSRTPTAARSDVSNAHAHDIHVDVDVSVGHPVADTLFGIFFEEINHAGEGGLYAEMVQDRSFDALALTQQFGTTEARGGQDIAPSAFSQLSHGRPIRSTRQKLPADWSSNLSPDGCVLVQKVFMHSIVHDACNPARACGHVGALGNRICPIRDVQDRRGSGCLDSHRQ